MNDSEIKALTMVECPHCKTTLMVEFTTSAPHVTAAYTPEMIEAAKQDALERVTKLGAPTEQTKPVIEWISDPNTIFSPSDVQNIIDGITGDMKK